MMEQGRRTGKGSGISRIGIMLTITTSMMLLAAMLVFLAVDGAAFQPAPAAAARRRGISSINASLQTPTESSSASTDGGASERKTTSASGSQHHVPIPLTTSIPLSAGDHGHHHHAVATDHHHHHRAAIETTNDSLIVPSSPSTTSTALPGSTPKSHVLSIDELNPLLKFDKNGKQKVLNATGLYHLVAILITMPFWIAAMEALHSLGNQIENFDPNRSKFDYSGKLWCRAYLSMTNCYPEIAGDVGRLKAGSDGSGKSDKGACLFVANHASFLDIAVLCCVLDPVFKFIAKDSLKKFPGVGRQLVGGEHLLIDRTNKRSQLKMFKQGLSYLKDGVPIMAFPEGARSPDGRLMSFKPGIFSMAVKANVPIVPLSLANTHAVMPAMGFLPVQEGEGKLRVFVHDPISVEGKSEEEISREVREALLSELPPDQHPLAEVE